MSICKILFDCFQEYCFEYFFPFSHRKIKSNFLGNSWKESYWSEKFLEHQNKIVSPIVCLSISFCHASLAQFASNGNALLCCNTSLLLRVISSLRKVSFVQFFRCEIDNALEALITLFQKSNFCPIIQS